MVEKGGVEHVVATMGEQEDDFQHVMATVDEDAWVVVPAMRAAPAEARATPFIVENTFFTIKEGCAAPVEQRSHSAPARLRSIKEQDAALPVEHPCSAAAADAHEQTLRIAGVEQYLWRGGAWRDAMGNFVPRKKSGIGRSDVELRSKEDQPLPRYISRYLHLRDDSVRPCQPMHSARQQGAVLGGRSFGSEASSRRDRAVDQDRYAAEADM